ncbi:MAG: hypothetical protein AB1657_01450 [Candidatus Micrarchaeota archaeon]
MKIDQKNATRMELRDYNWTFLLGGAFLLLIFLVNVFLHISGRGDASSLIYVGISGIIGLVGLFLLAVASVVKVDLDKKTNEFSFSQKKLLHSWVAKHRLDEIMGLRLEKTRSGATIWRVHTLTFLFKKGAALPVTLALVRHSKVMDEQIKVRAEKIAEFIGVRLEIAGY